MWNLTIMEGLLLLNCGSNISQVFAKAPRGFLQAPGQIAVELQLAAKQLTCTDLLRLPSLRVPDGVGEVQDVSHLFLVDEDHAVGVGEDKVGSIYRPITNSCRPQRFRCAPSHSLWTRWCGPETEYRKTDRGNLRTVSMQTPDHNARKLRGLSLKGNEITNAGLISAPSVIDHQHIPGCRLSEGFKEDVDAPEVHDRQHASSGMHGRPDRRQPCRPAPNRGTCPDASVSNMGGA